MIEYKYELNVKFLDKAYLNSSTRSQSKEHLLLLLYDMQCTIINLDIVCRYFVPRCCFNLQGLRYFSNKIQNMYNRSISFKVLL